MPLTRLAALIALAIPLTVACTATEPSPAATDTAGPSPEATMTPPAPAPESGGTRSPASKEKPRVTPAPGNAESDSCGASKVRERWTNALPSEDVKANIAKTVGQRRIRYYTDGDPITMDYSEERLNVVLGKDGRIAEFRCG